MTVIYQVTDTHVPDDPAEKVAGNFRQLMDYVHDNPADLLVISGDLTKLDASLPAYQWILEQIPSGQETVILPGNHDDAGTMFAVFGKALCRDPDFQFTIPLGDIDLVFSNTGSTHFPADQLDAVTSDTVRAGSVLFTHFPTRVVGDGFMDRTYPLADVDAVDARLSVSHIRHVFCGHFHTEADLPGPYNLHVTPSPAFDVDLESVKPKIGPPRIPLRRIDITGREVATSVIYLDDEAA